MRKNLPEDGADPRAGDMRTRSSVLLELGDRLRGIRDARAMKAAAAEFLARHVGVARAGYGEIVEDGYVIRVEEDWSRGVPSLAGEARFLDGFGPAVAAELRAGKTVRIEDCRSDPRARGEAIQATWDSIQLRAVVAVPLVREGELSAFVYMHEPAPRAWQDWEVDLAQEVAERTWEAVERARIESALRVSEERLRAVADAMPALISYFDSGQYFRFANRAYQEWFGRPLDEIVGHHLRQVMGEEMYEARRPYIEQALNGRRVDYQVDFPGPERRVTRVNHVPDMDANGTVRGVYSLVQDISDQALVEQHLRDDAHALEVRNRVGAAIASELDLEKLIQLVTDAAVEVTGAQFGAFFYLQRDLEGQNMMLYTLSGADRSAFESMGLPRPTAIFKPTFDGTDVVRSDDILTDPRYGKNKPHKGMPTGHMPVRSYLAVPVKARDGTSIGGLFFGHPEPGRFSERHEAQMVGIAAKAAIAFDNARLYQNAQQEIAQRKQAESHLSLLVNELNHRVKNTLAIVQGIAHQTFKGASESATQVQVFEGRLLALAEAHSVLTNELWEHAQLADIVHAALVPFHAPASNRLTISGPAVRLRPQSAVSLAMAVHELATNAVKYGAWSNDDGRVQVSWTAGGKGGEDRLLLCWKESGGPPVEEPTTRGFGSRMIERALAAELGGPVVMRFEPGGLVCAIEAKL